VSPVFSLLASPFHLSYQNLSEARNREITPKLLSLPRVVTLLESLSFDSIDMIDGRAGSARQKLNRKGPTYELERVAWSIVSRNIHSLLTDRCRISSYSPNRMWRGIVAIVYE
jgi:hypothetical protein